MQPLWETIHIVFFVMVVLMLMEFIELYRMGKGGGVLFLGDRHPFVQLLVAALLGFIPGCVGGLMVVAFTRTGPSASVRWWRRPLRPWATMPSVCWPSSRRLPYGWN
ncbi:MAG: hypothetical protein NC396_07480 [Bacteroides sp.]|nr:hypothetical protein [Bacteroides sp.]MCM1086204.1 hypothetical protein [Bacteroides sp.]